MVDMITWIAGSLLGLLFVVSLVMSIRERRSK